MIIDRPVPFQGTPEERKANVESHRWRRFGGEVVCANCDCKPWHAAALYPCGVEPPREQVEVGESPSLLDLHPGMVRFGLGSVDAAR